MLVLPDDILFQIAETQRPNPNVVSDESISAKPQSKLKAILRKNKIKKEPELGHYTKDYYKSTFDFLLKTQAKFWDVLNRYTLGDTFFAGQAQAQEDYSYIAKIDRSEDEEEEESCPVCPSPLNNSFIGRIWKAVKAIWNGFQKLLEIRKWLKRARQIYDLIKNWGSKKKSGISKLWNKVKRFFRKAKSRLAKFWKKRVRPILKRLWKWLKRKFRKIKNILKKAFKKFKKLFNRFKKWILKKLKKILIKAFKKIAKTLAKQLIKWVLRIVAGMLTATGIGAIIGAAIIAATWAWDAYDMVRPEEEEPDDDNELDEDELEDDDPDSKEAIKEQQQALEKSTKPKKSSKANTPAFKTKPAQARTVEYHEDGRLKMGLGEGRHKDAVVDALYANANDKFVIFGSLYEFYQYCYKWLQGQEQFAINGIKELDKGFNALFEILNDYAYNIMKYDEKVWFDYFLEKYKFDPFNNRNRTKPKPKDWQVEHRIEKVDKFVTDSWNKGGRPTYFYIRYKLGSWYAADTSFKSGEVDNGSNYKGGNAPGKWMKKLMPELKESNKYFLKEYPQYTEYNPADISPIDKVKLTNVEQLIKQNNKPQEEKMNAMSKKNMLLYDMWNRAAWIENGFDQSMLKNNRYSSFKIAR